MYHSLHEWNVSTTNVSDLGTSRALRQFTHRNVNPLQSSVGFQKLKNARLKDCKREGNLE